MPPGSPPTKGYGGLPLVYSCPHPIACVSSPSLAYRAPSPTTGTRQFNTATHVDEGHGLNHRRVSEQLPDRATARKSLRSLHP